MRSRRVRTVLDGCEPGSLGTARGQEIAWRLVHPAASIGPTIVTGFWCPGI